MSEPTEVIACWIPHDARWHAQARRAAHEGLYPLRTYVTALVLNHRDGGRQVVDEYDLATLRTVLDDLSDLPWGDLDHVEWSEVQRALLTGG